MNSRLRILCPEPRNFSAAGLDAWSHVGDLVAEDMTQEDLEAAYSRYDVILLRLATRVTREMIAGADRLRVVVSPTTGADHIDVSAAQERGVKVILLRAEVDFLNGLSSTAELAFGLLLSLVRYIPAATRHAATGDWDTYRFRGRELAGMRLGVLGFGRLGSMVARYGAAFGMHVSAYDIREGSIPNEYSVARSLEALLRSADVLSVHLPLTPSTEELLGERELRWLPRGAYVVNTARGELLNEEAVVRLLDEGHLAGFAADVIRAERTTVRYQSPLVRYASSHTNLLLTPHIGGAAEEAIEAADLFILGRFREWWEAEPTR